ncbi:DNA-directed primase/polymerase protein-like [Zootermopsis nevadensis]|uniref:DNA-directed primase/polymerase protein n=1 Tax=Zootermopsis nevadensis TaxID=136037 RepID=A0A067RA09_ZOONE|nr:DNA-directed primase/polymerase protein-like [Zootermopsis nevadensis]KDR20422.1 Coiled-coil domain-containing protein [Zootermopsis nevadensis]
MSVLGHHQSLTLTPKKFYGKNKSGKVCEIGVENFRSKNNCKELQFQKWPRQLDPSATWKIFKKQQEALVYVQTKKNGLMAFVFQDKFGCRLFLVAHPSVFWFYDSKRSSEDRSSYEIILEHAVCKLYFDLEFSIECNCQHDGNRMVESFIKIVSFHMKKEWDITVNRHHVLDLDSSTEKKFSRHLIFMLPNAVFQDNYNVGNFVKNMCSELRLYINEHSKKEVGAAEGKHSYGNVDRLHVCELLVLDRRGTYRLFCDEGVYTKNRHFRLYMSSKRNKNAPLIVSKENQYKPTSISRQDKSEDMQLFLDSLITYVPVDTNDLRVLKYGHCVKQELQLVSCPKVPFEGFVSSCDVESPYPEVDKFVNNLILPGRIWRWFYFSSGNHIVYDIIGYRYCGNIGRQHRSNNIKYVVNLTDHIYYQKCYDPDCANYRSAECTLPPEVTFLLEDDSFLKTAEDDSSFSMTLGHFGILEEDFLQLMDAVECVVNSSHNILHPEDIPSVPSEFPEYGLSDHDVSSALDILDNSKC